MSDKATIRNVVLENGKEIVVEVPLEESDIKLCTDHSLDEIFDELVQAGDIKKMEV